MSKIKKFTSLLSIVLILILATPIEPVAADRSSGRGSGGGSHGSGGTYRGYPGHGGAPRYGGAPGHRGYPHGYYGGGGRYHYYPGGVGAFLPGLIIGGILGWSLAPPYSSSPPYYAPPDYYYPPPVEGDQAPPAGKQLSIYPREGQSQDQQDRDHVVCHEWAVGQAGFDPFLPAPTDRREAERDQKSSHYLQALESCLDARGYTLR